MATVTITINTDNAAFGDDPDHELARILASLAFGLRRGVWLPDKLSDANGNTVGTVEVTS